VGVESGGEALQQRERAGPHPRKGSGVDQWFDRQQPRGTRSRTMRSEGRFAAGGNQRFLGDDEARVAGEDEQDVHVAVGDRDGPAIGGEAALVAVEGERSEAVDVVRGHSGHIVRVNGGRRATSGAESVQAPRGGTEATSGRP
jgi:hypothetical protein